MGESDVFYLFAPIIFFIIVTLLVSQIGTTFAQITARNAFITCPYPDFNNGINNVTVGGCSHINHPTPYKTESFTLWNYSTSSCIFFSCGGQGIAWTATLPFGWISYPADMIVSIFSRINDELIVFALVTNLSSNLPLTGQYIFGIVYLVFGAMFVYGIWINIAVRIIGAIRG